MNKEINNTSKNMKLQRDPILDGKLTGYPSKDLPWNAFYRKTPIRNIKLNQTIYDMVFKENRYNMDDDAIGYLGVDITFRELKSKVDRFADALIKNGVKKDDVVLMGVSNSPEAVMSLLALNKIGAVSKWFDIRASEKDIEEYANSSSCKYMITFDMLIPKIEKAINKTSLTKVIVINPTDSLSLLKQKLYKLKCLKDKTFIAIPKDKKYIAFNEFIKCGDKNSKLESVKFDGNKPSIMIQSSGTTGKPKTIVHADSSCVNSAHKMAYCDWPLGRGKKVLVALPPWIAYGQGNATIASLAYGSKVELSPNFDPDTLHKYIGKYTFAFAAPFHYRYLKEHFSELTEKQREDFKMVQCLVSGGDKITVEENRDFEETFGTVLVNGYGNNEGWGALTVNPTLHNKYGTVGIPKCGDIMISYDGNTGLENKYGEIGEICSLTDTSLLYYQDNEEETKKILQQHKDGLSWIHTGDLGFIDEEGFVHLRGRARRVITRLGFKISAYTIEDKITEHKAVKECVAISVNDEFEEHAPMVYIVLKDEYKSIKESIENDIYSKCQKELKEYEIPKYFMIVDSLPYTQNGKYDFVTLEKQGNEYVESLNPEEKVKVLRRKPWWSNLCDVRDIRGELRK